MRYRVGKNYLKSRNTFLYSLCKCNYIFSVLNIPGIILSTSGFIQRKEADFNKTNSHRAVNRYIHSFSNANFDDKYELIFIDHQWPNDYIYPNF